MSVRIINLVHAVQLPGNAGATRCINLNTRQDVRIERVEHGFELHFGKLADGQWRASGAVKVVPWTNVLDWDETRAAKVDGPPVSKEQKR